MMKIAIDTSRISLGQSREVSDGKREAEMQFDYEPGRTPSCGTRSAKVQWWRSACEGRREPGRPGVSRKSWFLLDV